MNASINTVPISLRARVPMAETLTLVKSHPDGASPARIASRRRSLYVTSISWVQALIDDESEHGCRSLHRGHAAGTRAPNPISVCDPYLDLHPCGAGSADGSR